MSCEEMICPAVEIARKTLAPTRSVHQLRGRDDRDAERADEIHVPGRAFEAKRRFLCQKVGEQQNERDTVHKKADGERGIIVSELAVERDHHALQRARQKQQEVV